VEARDGTAVGDSDSVKGDLTRGGGIGTGI
jgi:hypothetical protein